MYAIVTIKIVQAQLKMDQNGLFSVASSNTSMSTDLRCLQNEIYFMSFHFQKC